MSDKTLEQQIAEMRRSFFEEGQMEGLWSQVQSSEGEEDPKVVEDLANYFFSNIEKDIAAVELDLEEDQVDFPIILHWFNKMKESSSSLGMLKITNKTEKAENFCNAENLEGIKESLIELKEEIETTKGKLEAYFELVKEARGGKSS